MNRHADHVRRLCAEGRIPWAHAYVDRLIEDNPGDPETARLKAMIEEIRERPPVAPLPDPKQPGGRVLAEGCGAFVLLVIGIGLIKWVMGLSGDMVGSALDLPADEDGDSLAGFLIVAAVGWALYFSWRAVKTRRSGIAVREALRRRKARSRATAAGLDDANMRLMADQHGTFLSFTGILAMAPRAIVQTDPEMVLRVWPPLMALGIFAYAWHSVGREQLVRAFRLSGFLVSYTVVSLAWVLALAVFPTQLDVSGAAGPYIFGWGLLGWLLPAPFLFIRARRMKRGGRLRLPAHWRR